MTPEDKEWYRKSIEKGHTLHPLYVAVILAAYEALELERDKLEAAIRNHYNLNNDQTPAGLALYATIWSDLND